jgi:hypothetical protein
MIRVRGWHCLGGACQQSVGRWDRCRTLLSVEMVVQPTKRRPKFGTLIAVGSILLTFPMLNTSPQPGGDPSWQAGLVMANAQHLRFGKEIIFTYGPLGFLAHPVLWGQRSYLAIVLAVVVLVGCVAGGFRVARTSLSSALAAPVMFVLVRYAWSVEPSTVLLCSYVFVGLSFVWLLSGKQISLRGSAAVGGFLALILLVKADSFVLCSLAALAMIVSGSWKSIVRRLSFMVASFSLFVLVLWLLAGQRLGDLGDWLVTSWSVLIGFNEAMEFRQPPFAPSRAVAMTVMFLALLSGIMLARRPHRVQCLRIVTCTLAIVWVGAKSGFVRFDGHAFRYVLLLVVLSAASIFAVGEQVGSLPKERTGLIRQCRTLQGAGCVLIVVILGLAGTTLSVFSFWNGPGNFASVVRLLADPRRQSEITAQGRRRILAADPVGKNVRSALSGKRVHAEATDIATIWALNNAVWTPAPIIQSYSAYTSTLDDLNAQFYEDEAKANAVLYRADYGDGHHPRFTSPKAIVAMVCNFDLYQTDDPIWDVFTRTKQRCGQPKERGVYRAKLGSPIDWEPTAEDDQYIVVGTFGLHRSLSERLNALMRIRPRTWSVTFGNGDLAKYRFDPGTAEQIHLLSVPSCIRGQLGKFDTRTYSPIGLYASDEAPVTPITLHVWRIAYRCS